MSLTAASSRASVVSFSSSTDVSVLGKHVGKPLGLSHVAASQPEHCEHGRVAVHGRGQGAKDVRSARSALLTQAAGHQGSDHEHELDCGTALVPPVHGVDGGLHLGHHPGRQLEGRRRLRTKATKSDEIK